jgi:WhiB family redox-sensing transcriptional regulator
MGLKDIPFPASRNADVQALVEGSIPDMPDWNQEGLCWETQDPLFFEPDEESAKQAIEICKNCRVRLNCLQSALGMGRDKTLQREGVWGGYSADHRHSLLKQIGTIKRQIGRTQKVR